MRFAGILALLAVCYGCSVDHQASSLSSRLVKKRDLMGEWYADSTLVKKQLHSAIAFTGMRCGVERVVFNVTEDRLLAYRSYDQGAHPKGFVREQNLVAAFKITDHLDHGDGPQRPWQDREYIKVDWSKNLAPHLECNSWLLSLSAVDISSDAHDATDPFRVRLKDGYMETTVNSLVEPDETACHSMGEMHCSSAQYRVKYAFRKVDHNNGYEPKPYPDHEPLYVGKDSQGKRCLEGDSDCQNIAELWLYSDAQGVRTCDPLKHNVKKCFRPKIDLNAQFGFFRTEFQAHDAQQGYPRRDRVQLINRWNIWQQSSPGGKTMPLWQRHPKKITYYLNPGFPKNLMAEAEEIANQWSLALANTVAKAKDFCNPAMARAYANKLNLPKDMLRGLDVNDGQDLKKMCRILFDTTKSLDRDEIFFTGDFKEILQVYGPLFEIRENSCNKNAIDQYVNKHSFQAALMAAGMVNINDDNMESACAVLESEAIKAGLSDIFSWEQVGDLRYSFLNGIAIPEEAGLLGYGPAAVDPKTGEIISGNANIYLATIRASATKSAQMVGYVERLAQGETTTESKEKSKNQAEVLHHHIHRSLATQSRETDHSSSKSHLLSNLEKIASLGMFHEHLGDFKNALPDAHDQGDMQAVLKTLFTDTSHHHTSGKHAEFFAARSACFMGESTGLPYGRLVRELHGKTMEEKIAYLVKRIFVAVSLHEIGHTLGLRHNFKGYKDAANYPPNFWGVETGDFRSKPGLDKEELRSSSIMAYHKRFNSDFSGLGMYDYAALLAGYADKVEVFDERDGSFVPTTFIDNLELFDYHDLPYLFAGGDANVRIKSHRNRVRDGYFRANRGGHMDVSSLGITAHPGNLYKRKVVDYQDLKGALFQSYFGNDSSIVQVPYQFCTDGHAFGDDFTCRPYLFGSSASEIIKSAIEDHELAHDIEALGGQTLPTTVPAYVNRAYSQVYKPITQALQHMYALKQSSSSIYPVAFDHALAVNLGVDFMSRVLEAVDPGDYCKNSDGNYVAKSSTGPCLDPITIDTFVGKKTCSDTKSDLLGSVKKVGFLYEKILALMTLVETHVPVANEFSRWQSHDGSAGFYRLFPDQLARVFSNIVLNNWAPLAGSVVVGAKTVELRPVSLLAPGEQDKTLPKILPRSSDILSDYALIFSMAGLSSPEDHKLDFAKRAKIRRLTPGQDLAITQDAQNVVYKDPTSGFMYHSRVMANQESDLGFLLLNDVLNYTSDGKKIGSGEGPWFSATSTLSKAKTALKSARANIKAMSVDVNSLETEVSKAESKLDELQPVLLQKINLIERVRILSDLLAD